MTEQIEPFVDADAVAGFLGLSRKTVLAMTRTGELPAHALRRNAERQIWRYKMSEIAAHFAPKKSIVSVGSPASRLAKRRA